MYRYATSAWRMIKKHRWRTLCLVLSADYEGKAFADGMLSYTLQEKWQLLHIVWLMDDTIGNGTKAELQDVITKGSDAIVMHSRMGHDDTFFEMIQELGVSKQGTVWIITEMTIQLDTNWQKLPQGLLKISLRRPEKHHDYIIYGNALHDAMSLFQHSFEESVKEYYDENRDVDCVKGNTAKKIRRIAKRYLNPHFYQITASTTSKSMSTFPNVPTPLSRHPCHSFIILNTAFISSMILFPVGRTRNYFSE